MIESFRLPMRFDVGAVQSELLCLSDPQWIPHFNTDYYSGNWNGIVLRAANGNTSTLYQPPDAQYSDTEFMSNFPSVRKILTHFECDILSVRFLRLGQGGVIKEHYDNAL